MQIQIQMRRCVTTNGKNLLVSFRQESERQVKDVSYKNTNTKNKMYFMQTQIQMKRCINTNGTNLLISFRQESERLVKVATKAGETGDCNLPPS